MVTLQIAGRDLPCQVPISTGKMMKLAHGMRSKHPMDVYASMYEFARALVPPEHHRELDEALDDLESIEDFNTALGHVIEEASGRPTEAASDSSPGQPPTEPKSRVVSLSQGTVQTATEPMSPGRSEAG